MKYLILSASFIIKSIYALAILLNYITSFFTVPLMLLGSGIMRASDVLHNKCINEGPYNITKKLYVVITATLCCIAYMCKLLLDGAALLIGIPAALTGHALMKIPAIKATHHSINKEFATLLQEIQKNSDSDTAEVNEVTKLLHSIHTDYQHLATAQHDLKALSRIHDKIRPILIKISALLLKQGCLKEASAELSASIKIIREYQRQIIKYVDSRTLELQVMKRWQLYTCIVSPKLYDVQQIETNRTTIYLDTSIAKLTAQDTKLLAKYIKKFMLNGTILSETGAFILNNSSHRYNMCAIRHKIQISIFALETHYAEVATTINAELFTEERKSLKKRWATILDQYKDKTLCYSDDKIAENTPTLLSNREIKASINYLRHMTNNIESLITMHLQQGIAILALCTKHTPYHQSGQYIARLYKVLRWHKKLHQSIYFNIGNAIEGIKHAYHRTINIVKSLFRIMTTKDGIDISATSKYGVECKHVFDIRDNIADNYLGTHVMDRGPHIRPDRKPKQKLLLYNPALARLMQESTRQHPPVFDDSSTDDYQSDNNDMVDYRPDNSDTDDRRSPSTLPRIYKNTTYEETAYKANGIKQLFKVHLRQYWRMLNICVLLVTGYHYNYFVTVYNEASPKETSHQDDNATLPTKELPIAPLRTIFTITINVLMYRLSSVSGMIAGLISTPLIMIGNAAMRATDCLYSLTQICDNRIVSAPLAVIILPFCCLAYGLKIIMHAIALLLSAPAFLIDCRHDKDLLPKYSRHFAANMLTELAELAELAEPQENSPQQWPNDKALTTMNTIAALMRVEKNITQNLQLTQSIAQKIETIRILLKEMPNKSQPNAQQSCPHPETLTLINDTLQSIERLFNIQGRNNKHKYSNKFMIPSYTKTTAFGRRRQTLNLETFTQNIANDITQSSYADKITKQQSCTIVRQILTINENNAKYLHPSETDNTDDKLAEAVACFENSLESMRTLQPSPAKYLSIHYKLQPRYLDNLEQANTVIKDCLTAKVKIFQEITADCIGLASSHMKAIKLQNPQLNRFLQLQQDAVKYGKSPYSVSFNRSVNIKGIKFALLKITGTLRHCIRIITGGKRPCPLLAKCGIKYQDAFKTAEEIMHDCHGKTLHINDVYIYSNAAKDAPDHCATNAEHIHYRTDTKPARDALLGAKDFIRKLLFAAKTAILYATGYASDYFINSHYEKTLLNGNTTKPVTNRACGTTEPLHQFTLSSATNEITAQTLMPNIK